MKRNFAFKTRHLVCLLGSLFFSSWLDAASSQYFSDYTWQNPADYAFNVLPYKDPKSGETLTPHQQLTLGQTNIFSTINFNGVSGPMTNPFTSPNQPMVGYTTSTANYNPLESLAYYLRFNPKWVFGLNVGHPFQSLTEFPEDAFTRFAITKSYYQSVDIAPGLAFQPIQWLALGVGFDALRFHAELANNIPGIPILNIPEAAFDIKATDWGYGWHAGMTLHPAKGTFLSLVYYSSVALSDLAGAATLTGVATTHTFTEATIPSFTRLKVLQALSERWALVGQAGYTGWSSIKVITLYNTPLGDIDLPFNYRNTWRYGAGVRYAPPGWVVLTGITFEQTPSNPIDRRLSFPEKNYYSVGFDIDHLFAKHIRAGVGYYHAFVGHVFINNNLGGIITQGDANSYGDELEFHLTFLV